MTTRYVTQSKWIELKKELLADYPMCKFCRIRPAVHLHHGIINKAKLRNKKMHKFLDHKFNAIEICAECHFSADAYEMRRTAYWINVTRYGDDVAVWYDELPIKIKEKME